MHSSILLLLAFTSITAACPGLFGMMGGGGGCGCGAPPPPSCGCGGRKKRSLPEKPTFYKISASGEDLVCNTPELKKIIVENMESSAIESSKSVNAVLETRQLNRFVVVCSENPFAFTARADSAYCGAAKNGHNCHAFAM
ncbi:Ground-like domain-containing protein [Caenorhabditis elegans]|uniref:Ground-like domain-containing protein n=1 Tax=Caenorhabditis elegans TaxID=6239 RepID=O61947_CAEEL|nr:Ground-like domain-containing protein [Caenorhabditis elegans]CCD63576.1 Ground-like domain-containing protein [Caenorhabditis elegans]|eukprot:NP_503995.1 GRound-Like (grd related) [Caenorhabditis elegans]